MATEAKGTRSRAAATRKDAAGSNGSSTLNAADEKALESIVEALTHAREGDFAKRLPALVQ